MNINPAVIIPVYKREMSEYEQISLRHACHFLSRHRLVMIKPETLDWSIPGLEPVSFPDHFFRSRVDYNRLMLSTGFYERFQEHSHILIYQLDSLALRDELIEWCRMDFDYIGASWYPDLITQYEGFAWSYAPIGCGNGGFSLRKVDTFLNHLRQRRPVKDHILEELELGNWSTALNLWKFRKHLDPANYVHHESLNEDVYYGIFASIFEHSFHVAPPEMGDLFSFEYAPQYLIRKNGGHLPFGCHAWHKFPDSLAFWAPYLLLK